MFHLKIRIFSEFVIRVYIIIQTYNIFYLHKVIDYLILINLDLTAPQCTCPSQTLKNNLTVLDCIYFLIFNFKKQLEPISYYQYHHTRENSWTLKKKNLMKKFLSWSDFLKINCNEQISIKFEMFMNIYERIKKKKK